MLWLPRNIIRPRVLELAEHIAFYYERRCPGAIEEGIVAITVLKGAIFFATDLIHELYNHNFRIELEFIGVKSYEGPATVSNNSPRQYLKPSRRLTDRHILLIDDIVDTGQTLKHIQIDLANVHRPKTLRTCVLLDKTSQRNSTCAVDFYGFRIPNVFVVGYGLDYKEQYRCLKHIQEIDPDEIDIRD